MSQHISYRIGDRLYLNITDSCTLECSFCPKSRGCYKLAGYDLRMEHRPDAAEIRASVGDPRDYEEVVFCGLGEPTLRLNVLLEVARDVRARGGRVRVDTDGLANLVHSRDVLPSLAETVDHLCVSMNAQDPDTYEQVSRPNLPGSFEAMLAFLAEAPRHLPAVTATAVEGPPGVDLAACERLAAECGVGFRRRALGEVD